MLAAVDRGVAGVRAAVASIGIASPVAEEVAPTQGRGRAARWRARRAAVDGGVRADLPPLSRAASGWGPAGSWWSPSRSRP